MFLEAALTRIASAYQLDAPQLITYANEDRHTGWDKGAGQWPVGSLWRVEGQTLYALVRAFQPRRLLELGTGYGCSATHLLQALAANGHEAALTCVDSGVHRLTFGPGSIGEGIPPALRSMVQIEVNSIDAYAQTEHAPFDFIFEDGMHSPDQVYTVWSSLPRLLKPGGVIVSHDALHYLVGADVRHGIEHAGITDALYLDIEPADCGLAIWKKPGEYHAQTKPARSTGKAPRRSGSRKSTPKSNGE